MRPGTGCFVLACFVAERRVTALLPPDEKEAFVAVLSFGSRRSECGGCYPPGLLEARHDPPGDWSKCLDEGLGGRCLFDGRALGRWGRL